jgi:hypothetical protein
MANPCVDDRTATLRQQVDISGKPIASSEGVSDRRHAQRTVPLMRSSYARRSRDLDCGAEAYADDSRHRHAEARQIRARPVPEV